MKKAFIFLLIVSIQCLFGGCNENSADQSVNGSRNGGDQLAGEAIGQRRMSESDLENTIRARLHNDVILNGSDLTVTAGNNEVTLSGVVETKVMRERAIELAKATQTGIVVEDRIEVRRRELSRSEYTEESAIEERERASERGENIGDSIDDARIHTMIAASLAGDQDQPQHKIRVDVSNNVVTLRGIVETAEQKVEAERVASETEGVKRVVNQLKVESRPGKSLAVEYSRFERS